MGRIGIWELLLVLAIVVLLFGTKRLGSLGADLGNAIRGFRKAMTPSEEEKDKPRVAEQPRTGEVIDAEAEHGEPSAEVLCSSALPSC
jgi:sec-independent protein translocase protein TatA